MKYRFLIPLLMINFVCFSQAGPSPSPSTNNSNNKARSIIFSPKKSFIYSTSTFLFNDKKYPSFKIFNIKNLYLSSFDAQLGLLSNGGAYLRLESENNYIRGNILIHLSTGKVIRCTDKFLREKKSNNYISYYYLTKVELHAIMDKDVKLKKIEYAYNGESNEVNASSYNENNLISLSKESNLLRLELGLEILENNNIKSSNSNSKVSSNNKKTNSANGYNYERDGPRSEDYSSWTAYVADFNKWQKNKNSSGTSSLNNRSTSSSNNRSSSSSKTNNPSKSTKNYKVSRRVILPKGNFGNLYIGASNISNPEINFPSTKFEIGYYNYSDLYFGLLLGIKKSDLIYDDGDSFSDYVLAGVFGLGLFENIIYLNAGLGYHSYNFNTVEDFGPFYDFGYDFYASIGLRIFLIDFGEFSLLSDISFDTQNNTGIGLGISLDL